MAQRGERLMVARGVPCPPVGVSPGVVRRPGVGPSPLVYHGQDYPFGEDHFLQRQDGYRPDWWWRRCCALHVGEDVFSDLQGNLRQGGVRDPSQFTETSS